MTVKELKRGEGALKMCSFVFNNNYNRYKQFLEEFSQGEHNIDKNFYLVEALASALQRPIILLSTLPEHKENPIIKYNNNIEHKPPLIFGVQKIEGHLVFFCHFNFNKNVTFCLDQHYQKIEIIGYMAKTIPENMQFVLRRQIECTCFVCETVCSSLSAHSCGVKLH